MNQLSLAEFSVDGAHQCPECERGFDSDMGVKVHYARSHDGSLASPTVECSWCGDEKTTTNYRKRSREHHFCDHECKGQWQSENHRGRDHPRWSQADAVCEWCGDRYTVPQHRENLTRFCSKGCHIDALGEKLSKRTGPDHHSWRGGESLYFAVRRCIGDRSWEYIASEYREQIGHGCEWCGAEPPSDRALDVHHIVPIRSGGSHHEENLMVLCRSCHSTVERFTDSLLNEVLV